jgi:hypothetical protein
VVAKRDGVQDDGCVRASDRDRERAASTLARAAGQGRLSLDTLSGRLDGALVARDVAALDTLTSDLPWWQRPPGALLRTAWRWLTVAEPEVGAPAQELAVDLDAAVVVVGRSSGCDIRLGDRMVSRRHAQLRRTEQGWHVIDLLSTNGTYLNGRRISSADALPGDELAFADVVVTLPR